MKAVVTRATCSTETPFFIRLEQAVGGDFQAAGDGDAAAVGQQVGTARGVKDFSKRTLPHQEMATLRADQLVARALSDLGRRGFVDKVEAGLAGFAHDGLDAVDQHLGAGGFVAARCSRG